MKKEVVLQRMKEDCLIAVIRAKNKEQGEKLVDSIIKGGINFIEITILLNLLLSLLKSIRIILR